MPGKLLQGASRELVQLMHGADFQGSEGDGAPIRFSTKKKIMFSERDRIPSSDMTDSAQF
jgi:hypothetical protein